MKDEERKIVRRDQIHNFLNSYFAGWRLNQILMTEKLLHEKYSFFEDVVKETKRSDDEKGDSTIAQEITNGLFFNAISETIQYIEDLFALLFAAKNPDFFIRDIVTYKAGKVEQLIKKKHTIRSICELFYFPYFDDLDESHTTEKTILNCYNILEKYLYDIQNFYEKYHFFYIQYKHGLTIALRPFGLLKEENIIKDKAGKHKPYLVAFDNMALNRLKGVEDIRFNKMVFMPGFTEPVQRNLELLHKEDNLTRFVFPPENTSIELMKSIAYKTKACIETIIVNLANFVDDKPHVLQLPEESIGKFLVFKFETNPFVKNEGSR